MQWFAHFVSALFRNPIFLSAVAAAIAADPAAPPEVKQDFEIITALGGIYAAKQSGSIVFTPDAPGGAPVPLAHITL